MHPVGQLGAVWELAPVHFTARKQPHSFATVEALQRLSSFNGSALQIELVQTASVRAPWHVAASWHEDGVVYEAGHDPATSQQSPDAQQNPFWQCVEIHAESPVHGWPSGFFGLHVEHGVPASQ